MDAPIRVGIIGASGGMGKLRLEHFTQDPRSAVVSACARDIRRLSEAVPEGPVKLVAHAHEVYADPDVDAVVTYSDRWMWDFTMYMLSLDITLRDGRTGFPMAVGQSMHASLTRKSPEEMVREVLGNIFAGSRR